MRFIFFVLSVVVLLLVGAVVAPSFVDWNKYKTQIVEQVKNATGLDVTIDGDLSLAVLPSPRVKIEEVSVDAPLKKKFETLLKMKQAEVSVELIPLFRKEVKVKSVTLVSPDIQIEIMEDGRPSWTTDKLAKAQQLADVAPQKEKSEISNQVLEAIALDKVQIKNGRLAFVDHQKSATHNFSDVNIDLQARSLKGPFVVDGDLVYQDKKIVMDVTTGKLPTGDEGLSVEAKISLPDATTAVDFKGVVTPKAPFDVQGQTNLKINSVANLTKVTGISMGGYAKDVNIEGLITANDQKINIDNMKLALDGFIANGKVAVQGLKAQNPIKVSGKLKSASVLNLDNFTGAQKQASLSMVKPAYAQSKATKDLVPKALSLPMPIDANIQFDLGGIKQNSMTIKGVFLDLNKVGKNTKASFKAMELPGQANLEGNVNVQYASQSRSSKTGGVTYSDPSVSYTVNGQAGQLATFLKTIAPSADTSAVTKLYKTAQFNLKGAVNGNSIRLNDSVVKLDDMVLGLTGSYLPASSGARAKASIDLSADRIDFDKIQAAQGKGQSSSGSKSKKEAVKPLQDLALPMDVDFDVSLQQARMNGKDLNGLRVAGDIRSNSLTLNTASVNNFAGATMSLKGVIGNLRELSDLDVNIYTKTNDLPSLAQALNVDISKLPQGVTAVEVSMGGKGSTDALNFDANVKALNGQFDAKGVAKSLLGTPSFSDLNLGVQHPNLVKAIQIVNPEFTGQAGLNQSINFSANANVNGKQYDLSNMKVTLGETSFSGDLKINAGKNPVSVRGNIDAGKIALDSLMGAKTSSGGSASSAGGDRWSKSPLDLSFMNTLDVDVALSAANITYGKWNFAQPSTDLKIGGGQLNVSNMKAGIFGGSANVTTQVIAAPLSISLSNKMNAIDLEQLAAALSGNGKLKTSGAVNFDMSVQSSGASPHALVNALAGTANLNGTNVTIKGFDLVKLAGGLAGDDKLLTSASNLVSGSLTGGETKFDTLKGEYKITNGKVNIQSMSMDNVEAAIKSVGYADLPSWFMKVDNEISFKNITDAKTFSIEIKGSMDNPKTFGQNIIQDFLKQKLQRQINKKLPDVLGDSTTEKLKKFGIVGEEGKLDINDLKPESLINNLLNPKKKEEAPAPVQEGTVPTEVVPAPAANDNVAPVQEQPPQEEKPAPAPAQKEAPRKIEKPEDALKTILENQGSPEDAVNDLIKGLF
jgi:uncharacterized protein involved in outer membrane biogenesis